MTRLNFLLLKYFSWIYLSKFSRKKKSHKKNLNFPLKTPFYFQKFFWKASEFPLELLSLRQLLPHLKQRGNQPSPWSTPLRYTPRGSWGERSHSPRTWCHGAFPRRRRGLRSHPGRRPYLLLGVLRTAWSRRSPWRRRIACRCRHPQWGRPPEEWEFGIKKRLLFLLVCVYRLIDRLIDIKADA